MSAADIAVILLIAAAVIYAIISCVRQKRNGGCCHNCTECSQCRQMPSQRDNQK